MPETGIRLLVGSAVSVTLLVILALAFPESGWLGTLYVAGVFALWTIVFAARFGGSMPSLVVAWLIAVLAVGVVVLGVEGFGAEVSVLYLLGSVLFGTVGLALWAALYFPVCRLMVESRSSRGAG